MFEIDVTPEIKLRQIEISDAQSIYSIIDKDRQFLRTWLPFVDYTKMVQDTEAFIKKVHSAPPDSIELTYVILHKNSIAGLIGFRGTDRANHKTEIGYWLSESKQGLGLVTLSCRKLIDMCFDILNMNRVQIKVAVENQRSKKVPLRLGLKLEGIEREGEFLNEKYADLEVYSILKKEWSHHI
jgi:ribosomal-protein-serine acetyltransferase